MASVTEIVNLALAHIRVGSINSLTEGSTQAQYASLLYPTLRDQMLKDAPWQFARKTDALALTTEELFEWPYAYQYPADCLQIHRMIPVQNQSTTNSGLRSRYYNSTLIYQNMNQPIEYQIINVSDNLVIGANLEELRMEYTVRVTDPNLFGPQFTLGLSHLLAAHLAVPIIGTDLGGSLQQKMLTLYEFYLKAAVASDLNQQNSIIPDSEFIVTRG